MVFLIIEELLLTARTLCYGRYIVDWRLDERLMKERRYNAWRDEDFVEEPFPGLETFRLLARLSRVVAYHTY
jgi:hypothetical protein